MNLDALLEPIPDRNQKQPCKVGRIVAGLEEPYKSALTTLLATSYADGGLADEAIQKRMDAAGLQVGATVINRHRKLTCTCGSVVNG